MRYWRDELCIEDFCTSYITTEKNGKDNYYRGKNPLMLYYHYVFSVALNWALAVFLLFYLHIDFVLYCLGFILFDVVMCYLDYKCFKKDIQRESDPIREQNIVKKLEDSYDYAYELTVNNVDKDTYDTEVAFNYFYDCLLEEKSYLKGLVEKVEQEEAKVNTKLSKDYEDKLDYFTSVYNRIKVLEKDFVCLKQLTSTLQELTELLKEKPEGVVELPKVIYIYLDEVQKVTTQMIGLDEDDKSKYDEQFSMISQLLAEKVDTYIERIRKCEINDIEVSLNVLLSELQANEGGK